MFPKLRFHISVGKDTDTFFAFVRDAEFDSGQSLRWAVFDVYPLFRKYWHDGKMDVSHREISSFVKDKYASLRPQIKKNMETYKKNWEKVTPDFFRLTSKLFPKTRWPKGKYICYPTLWGMFPRFLEDMTFQVPYQSQNKKFVNAIIGHELLHFIFYQYFFKKYPRYRQPQYDMFSWHVSEIFNAVIEKTPAWKELFEAAGKPYPEHKKIITKLGKTYKRLEGLRLQKLVDDIIRNVRQSYT